MRRSLVPARVGIAPLDPPRSATATETATETGTGTGIDTAIGTGGSRPPTARAPGWGTEDERATAHRDRHVRLRDRTGFGTGGLVSLSRPFGDLDELWLADLARSLRCADTSAA
ncbi:MAG: hypothetical protein ACXV5Q_00230 [Frankiaceae bacterium]